MKGYWEDLQIVFGSNKLLLACSFYMTCYRMKGLHAGNAIPFFEWENDIPDKAAKGVLGMLGGTARGTHGNGIPPFQEFFKNALSRHSVIIGCFWFTIVVVSYISVPWGLWGIGMDEAQMQRQIEHLCLHLLCRVQMSDRSTH